MDASQGHSLDMAGGLRLIQDGLKEFVGEGAVGGLDEAAFEVLAVIPHSE